MISVIDVVGLSGEKMGFLLVWLLVLTLYIANYGSMSVCQKVTAGVMIVIVFHVYVVIS